MAVSVFNPPYSFYRFFALVVMMMLYMSCLLSSIIISSHHIIIWTKLFVQAAEALPRWHNTWTKWSIRSRSAVFINIIFVLCFYLNMLVRDICHVMERRWRLWNFCNNFQSTFAYMFNALWTFQDCLFKFIEVFFVHLIVVIMLAYQ